jgi:hypothetical protein
MGALASRGNATARRRFDAWSPACVRIACRPMPAGRAQRLLDPCLAAAAGALLWAGANALVPAAAAPFPGHGERFAAMAADPLAFDGAFPHRVLWPLLARGAAACGLDAVGFSALCNGLLLAVVCHVVRARAGRAVDGLLAAAAVAASGGVLVYQTMACFSDPLNLALLLLAAHWAARPARLWGCVLVGALSHELMLFFVPWLSWLRLRHGGSWRRDGLAGALVVAAYGGWRLFVAAQAPPGGYGAGYYVENNFWAPWLLPALLALWLLVAIVEFGPLLAVVAAGWRVGLSSVGGRAGLSLFVAGVLPLLWFAYDVMRFAALLAVPLALCAADLLRAGGHRARIALVALVTAAAATYVWQHPVPSQQGGAAFTRITADVLQLAAPHVQPGAPVAFAPAMGITGELLARHAWTCAAAAAALVGAGVLGMLLARYVGSASVGGSAPDTRRNASP